MAIRYAVAAGNWSSLTTWDGGESLPAVDDDVYANNFVVTIDQDISVNSLWNRSNASPVVAAGGQFVISDTGGGTRQITLPGTLGGSFTGSGVALLVISATSGTVVLNVSEVRGGIGTSYRAVDITGNGVTVTTTAPTFAGTSSGTHAFNISAPAIVNIADVTGGGNSGYGLNVTGAATITCGHITGGTGSSSHGASFSGSSTGATLMAQDVTSGTSSGYGISITTGVNVSVQNVFARAVAAIYNSHASSVIDIRGSVTASGTACGYHSTVGNIAKIRGPLYDGPNGYSAVYAQKWMLYGSVATFWTFSDDSLFPATGSTVLLSNSLEGVPDASDVRSGVSFGAAGSVEGTCVVPNPANVAFGIPVDHTTGTAVLTPQHVWDHEIGTGVTAKERILSTATIDSTSQQLTAALTT